MSLANALTRKARRSRSLWYRPRLKTLEERTLRSFLPAVNYPVALNPASVAVADFNNDGALDLATASSGSNAASVLRGNGDGTFQPVQNFGVGLYPVFVVATELNADNAPDLVAVNFSSGTVSVLLGNGNGSFQP